jgi:hypothetical protein
MDQPQLDSTFPDLGDLRRGEPVSAVGYGYPDLHGTVADVAAHLGVVWVLDASGARRLVNREDYRLERVDADG